MIFNKEKYSYSCAYDDMEVERRKLTRTYRDSETIDISEAEYQELIHAKKPYEFSKIAERIFAEREKQNLDTESFCKEVFGNYISTVMSYFQQICEKNPDKEYSIDIYSDSVSIHVEPPSTQPPTYNITNNYSNPTADDIKRGNGK